MPCMITRKCGAQMSHGNEKYSKCFHLQIHLLFLAWEQVFCYYLQPLLTDCCYFLLLAATCYYLSPLATTCYYLLLVATTCYHLLPLATTCYFLLLLASASYYLLLLATTYFYLLLLATTCYASRHGTQELVGKAHMK